jgi:hypothetical protein
MANRGPGDTPEKTTFRNAGANISCDRSYIPGSELMSGSGWEVVTKSSHLYFPGRDRYTRHAKGEDTLSFHCVRLHVR